MLTVQATNALRALFARAQSSIVIFNQPGRASLCRRLDVRTVQKVLQPFVGFDDWYRHCQDQNAETVLLRRSCARSLLSAGPWMTNATPTDRRMPSLQAWRMASLRPIHQGDLPWHRRRKYSLFLRKIWSSCTIRMHRRTAGLLSVRPGVPVPGIRITLLGVITSGAPSGVTVSAED